MATGPLGEWKVLDSWFWDVLGQLEGDKGNTYWDIKVTNLYKPEFAQLTLNFRIPLGSSNNAREVKNIYERGVEQKIALERSFRYIYIYPIYIYNYI